MAINEAALDIVRAIERDHIRATAAESKSREDSLVAHIASLQAQLKAAENISRSESIVVDSHSAVSSRTCDKEPSCLTKHLEMHNIPTSFSATRFECGCPTGQMPLPESSHSSEDDPLEVLGRLVESNLGRQVNLLALQILPHLLEHLVVYAKKYVPSYP